LFCYIDIACNSLLFCDDDSDCNLRCIVAVYCCASFFIAVVIFRSVLLGLAANSTLKDVELNLSGNALGSSALQVLEACLPALRNISVLDLSDNGTDTQFSRVMHANRIVFLFLSVFFVN